MAFGIEIRRADGTIQLSSETGITTFRHLVSHQFEEDTASTVPAPEFDEAIGVVQVVYHADRTYVGGGYDGFVAPNVYDIPDVTHGVGVLSYTPPGSSNNDGPPQALTVNLYHYS